MNAHDLTEILIEWSNQITRLAMHDSTRFARTTGVTLVQMNGLNHLYYRGPVEMTEFREMMQITPAGASLMIERMVQQGLVQRAETPDDRRVRLVSLTDEGRKIVEESLVARRAWIEQLVEQVPEGERKHIAEALGILNQYAEKMRIKPF